MIERHETEAFLVLAEESHFGHTAERLHVSVARISQTIKKLERRIGAPLFERTSRRVALTPVGRQLYDDLSPAYTSMQAGLKKAIDSARGVTGTLRIGFVGAATGQLLLKATSSFNEDYPDCEIEIREVQMSDAAERLRQKDIELLLVCLPLHEPDLTAGPVLFTEPRMLAVSSQHDFAQQASLSIEDLASEKVIGAKCFVPDYWRDSQSPRATPAGKPIAPGPFAQTFQEVLTLVGAGQGVFPVGAHVARYYARPDVTYVPLRDTPPLAWGTVWLTTSDTGRLATFTQALVKSSKDSFTP